MIAGASGVVVAATAALAALDAFLAADFAALVCLLFSTACSAGIGVISTP